MRRTSRRNSQPDTFQLLFLVAIFCVASLFLYASTLAVSAPPTNHSSLPTDPDRVYQEQQAELTGIVEKQDPRIALNELEQRMRNDQVVLRICHGLVHEIGRAAYRRYGDFTAALSYEQETCGSGYLHGVIEAKFAAATDINHELATTCSLTDGRCLHGVGHGIMYYTENDVPESLRLCDSYQSANARHFCAEGVFMENFSADQKLHVSRYVSAENPFRPCDQQAAFYKGSCYFYAPSYFLRLYPDHYAEALAWCRTAEPAYIGTCTSGVGSRIMKYTINDPRFVERTCMAAEADQVAACLDGMASYWLVNFNDPEKGEELCRQLEAANQPACREAVERRRDWFGD